MRAGERLRAALGWKPVARPRRPVLFVNPRSGGGTAVRLALAQRARELGIEPIVLEPDHDLAALVADAVARGADALGMAGGDGQRRQRDAADGPGDCVGRVMHAGVYARVGHQRSDDAERDPGTRPGGANAGREGERGRGVP